MSRTFFGFLFVTAIISANAQTPPDAVNLEAVVTTELGVFRFEFAPDKAPKHVAQFISLANKHYYDGGAFHRALANAIIQGGDPLLKALGTPRARWGTGGLTMLASEFSDLKHERGVVSTVRIPNQPNSDGAQFFVCVAPQPGLDGQYSAFGRVTEGMGVVEKISQSPVDSSGILIKPVKIISIVLEQKKQEPFKAATIDELRKTVTLETTVGMMKVKMEPDWAPETVRNFLKLVSVGWYDGTPFHRIVKGFVIQGGQPTRPTEHPGDRWVHDLKAEFRPDVKHTRGIISMAHGDNPNSGNTSFFLVLGDAPHLDGNFAAFGRIIECLDVLAAFEKEDVDGEAPKRHLELVKARID
jgi:cyclophilin family peptidyl-prolyl cis-trans isomerase